MDSIKYCVVLSTVPDAKAAEEIASGLVQEKLAACVSEVPQVSSHYMWEGKLRKEVEILLVIKTKTGLMGELLQYIRKKHPAKVPEIIALPITGGSKPYLEWLGAGTRMARQSEEGFRAL
ncbi:MAG: divalent-cation tolerance protein CutA [Elusimicrobia bacterium]|nr:divalent-cation tolerance protein CutA [Elusimicrobiota bacterium]